MVPPLALLTVLALAGEPSSPVARIDLHAHLTMRRAASPIFRGEPGRGPLASSGSNFWTNPLDADALYAAGARALTLLHFSDNALGGAMRLPCGESPPAACSTSRCSRADLRRL